MVDDQAMKATSWSGGIDALPPSVVERAADGKFVDRYSMTIAWRSPETAISAFRFTRVTPAISSS